MLEIVSFSDRERTLPPSTGEAWLPIVIFGFGVKSVAFSRTIAMNSAIFQFPITL